MWIKDMETGKVRLYGTDRHDALMVSEGRLMQSDSPSGLVMQPMVVTSPQESVLGRIYNELLKPRIT